MNIKATTSNVSSNGLVQANDKAFARGLGTEILHVFRPGEPDPKDIQAGRTPSERLVKIAQGLSDIVTDKKILTNLDDKTIAELTEALRRHLLISSNNKDKLERALRYLARNPILFS